MQFFFKQRLLTSGNNGDRWESTKSNSGRISALTFIFQLSTLKLSTLNFDLREHGRSFNRAGKRLCHFPGGHIGLHPPQIYPYFASQTFRISLDAVLDDPKEMLQLPSPDL